MGIKKVHTLNGLFRRFIFSFIILLTIGILIPFWLELAAVNAGYATRADQSELQVKALIPTLTVAPDIRKVAMPPGCRYLILNNDFQEIYSNMDAEEKDTAVKYAKGAWGGQDAKKQFTLVVRKNEICILQYYIGSQFTMSWLPEYFPTPDVLTAILMGINSLLVVILLTKNFARKLRAQLTPLLEATKEISVQNLDFTVGHSKIREFEDVLLSFSNMKDSLKTSLEQQWKGEQAQKEQIAALAHDLKTPLTIIQGNADLINETKLDAEQKLYAGYIADSSEQMQLYIKTLIEISRAAAGYQLHMENVDFQTYMKHLSQQMKSICRTKKIHLQMQIPSVSCNLNIDKMLLERAVMNVVNNALEHSPQGGKIYVETEYKKDFLCITIIDEGTGFSPEALQHAQERFFMEDESRSLRMHSGMGLYIADTIVKQHKGQLILENSVELHGAKVIIKIPFIQIS